MRLDVRTCAINGIGAAAREMLPDAIISISDPAERTMADRLIAPLNAPVLRLAFLDISHPLMHVDMPALDHVREIIGFTRLALSGSTEERSMLIHCHAGLSRSTAAAAIAMACDLSEDSGMTEEAGREIAGRLVCIEPLAWPNRTMLALAEEIVPEWRGCLLGPVPDYIEALQENGNGQVWRL